MPVKVEDGSLGRRKVRVEAVSAVEYKQLETRFKALQKEFGKLQAAKVSEEKLIKSLQAGVASLPRVRVPEHKKSRVKVSHEEDQIQLFSDVHSGEVIDPAETDGFNAYNFEIMCNRLWHLQNQTLALKDLHESAGMRIPRLWVAALGDNVTGEIHSMAETNEFPILATIQQTALIFAQMLMKYASAYEEVVYIGVDGNHDRRHEKPRTKQSYDNWGRMLNWCVSLLCKDQPNIRFIIPKSPFFVQDIRGWKWLLRHGHGKTNSFAGIPYYGLARKHTQLQELYRKRGGFDYEAMGHYHQQAVLKDDRVYINGSVVGANEFAINELAAFSPPSQKLIGIDDKHGVTYTYRIMLEEARTHGFVYDPNDVFEHKASMASFVSTHFDTKKKRR